MNNPILDDPRTVLHVLNYKQALPVFLALHMPDCPQPCSIRWLGHRTGIQSTQTIQESLVYLADLGFGEAMGVLSHENASGYIYLCSANGRYKIGMSNNPEERIVSLNSGSPYPIRLVYSFPADDPVTAERELHEMFRSHGAFMASGLS
jgi:hypothetical protein